MSRDGIFRGTVVSYDGSNAECIVLCPQLYGSAQFSARAASNDVAGLTPRAQGDTVWVFFPGGEDAVPYWFTMSI